jgi:hypothetical protein
MNSPAPYKTGAECKYQQTRRRSLVVLRGDNFARAALLSVAKRVSVDPDESAQERKGMKSDSSAV